VSLINFSNYELTSTSLGMPPIFSISVAMTEGGGDRGGPSPQNKEKN
jgi:hypothetical protein